MQTILGAGGAIGLELAKALPKYTSKIRLVSRNPKKVNPQDELLAADLLQPGEVKKAVKGSSVVYVTIGFPYQTKFWQQNWPSFMRSVVDACIEENCKLVFFDNMYMYDQAELNGMTEEVRINPASKKGKVRASLVKIIMDEVEKGTLTALIARAADFYGPGIGNTSMLNETILKPLHQGKKATIFGPGTFRHSFTYTPDAGLATAMLGNTESTWNQVWHLPTATNPPTLKQWVQMSADLMKVKGGFRPVSKMMLQFMGLFVPIMREFPEMLYQYDREYVFNSNKFEHKFNFTPTPYTEGLKEVIQRDFS